MKYRIIYTRDAYIDIENLSNAIKYKYKAPLTAFKYLRDLRQYIAALQTAAHIYQLQTHKSIINKYGIGIRRVNFKKMAILYTIHKNTVYILRIGPSAMITKL